MKPPRGSRDSGGGVGVGASAALFLQLALGGALFGLAIGAFLLRSAFIWGHFAALCIDLGVIFLLRSALIWHHFASFCSDLVLVL